MSDFGVFESVSTSSDEGRIAKQAAKDKLAAAVYDVREKHGDWLFGARDIHAFRDRVALAHVSICQTIEPHLHARTGVQRKVIKTLEREWRQKIEAAGPPPQPDIREFDDVRHRNVPESKGYVRQLLDDSYGRPSAEVSWDDPETGYGGRNWAKHPLDQLETIGREDQPTLDLRNGIYPSEDIGTEVAWKRRQQKDSRTRRADNTGPEQDNKGDFDGYLDSVDDGAESKIDHNFVGEGTPHNEDGDHNFVDTYTGSREFQLIARLIQAEDLTGNDPNGTPAGIGAGASAAPPAVPSVGGAASGAAPAVPAANTAGAPAGSPAPAAMTGPAASIGGAASAMPAPTVTASILRYANWCLAMRMRPHNLDTLERYAAKRSDREYFILADAISGQRKTAAPNYLQKADEALTNLLNQKAEEFQNSVQALQQALVTVQQAEALEQQANPLNVQPPAGTVNVMPGGGDPSQGGGDGAPVESQAAALTGMGGGDPSQQMLARRRRAGFDGIHTKHLIKKYRNDPDSDHGDELFEELHNRASRGDMDAAREVLNDSDIDEPGWTYETGGQRDARRRQAADTAFWSWQDSSSNKKRGPGKHHIPDAVQDDYETGLVEREDFDKYTDDGEWIEQNYKGKHRSEARRRQARCECHNESGSHESCCGNEGGRNPDCPIHGDGTKTSRKRGGQGKGGSQRQAGYWDGPSPEDFSPEYHQKLKELGMSHDDALHHGADLWWSVGWDGPKSVRAHMNEFKRQYGPEQGARAGKGALLNRLELGRLGDSHGLEMHDGILHNPGEYDDSVAAEYGNAKNWAKACREESRRTGGRRGKA